MKRVRMLLRVSSNQQLEADGDLSIQRQILLDYIRRRDDWALDAKEYFEGSKSAYKNKAEERDILQDILRDAKNKEFDILVPYKDDRVGRLMWDTPAYIMSLKAFGIDVFTVKDGCITPELDDITGQMMLAIRYGSAQKSSADTGMRVKDTAQKLVQKGKFMGGRAPYGYRLEYSGEISKHGRALQHLVVVPEQAEAVRHIYDLSLAKGYGSLKIAGELNRDARYRNLAPNDVWKSGTVTSILTNPIYAGHTAYKRRESRNGRMRRLDSADWIVSAEANGALAILDGGVWDMTQERRRQRAKKYGKTPQREGAPAAARQSGGALPLADVLHCGYCGCKLVNGSRYNYWTIKATGERRASKVPLYKCQNAWQGVPHAPAKQYRADAVEALVFDVLAAFIGRLQADEDLSAQIAQAQSEEMRRREQALKQEQQTLERLRQKIAVIRAKLPEAMAGDCPLSLEELVALMRQQEAQAERQAQAVRRQEQALHTLPAQGVPQSRAPTWPEVFLRADPAAKRVLTGALAERIDLKQDEIVIRFRLSLGEGGRSRIDGHDGTTPYRCG